MVAKGNCHCGFRMKRVFMFRTVFVYCVLVLGCGLVGVANGQDAGITVGRQLELIREYELKRLAVLASMDKLYDKMDRDGALLVKGKERLAVLRGDWEEQLGLRESQGGVVEDEQRELESQGRLAARRIDRVRGVYERNVNYLQLHDRVAYFEGRMVEIRKRMERWLGKREAYRELVKGVADAEAVAEALRARKSRSKARVAEIKRLEGLAVAAEGLRAAYVEKGCLNVQIYIEYKMGVAQLKKMIGRFDGLITERVAMDVRVVGLSKDLDLQEGALSLSKSRLKVIVAGVSDSRLRYRKIAKAVDALVKDMDKRQERINRLAKQRDAYEQNLAALKRSDRVIIRRE